MKKELTQMLRNRIDEKTLPTAVGATQNPSDSTSQYEGTNYDKIASILNNPLVNTAEIARQLWGDKNQDTNRSLFKKKLDRAKNDTGSVYSFDEEELLKISNALMNFSTQIRKSVGKEGKG